MPPSFADDGKRELFSFGYPMITQDRCKKREKSKFYLQPVY